MSIKQIRVPKGSPVYLYIRTRDEVVKSQIIDDENTIVVDHFNDDVLRGIEALIWTKITIGDIEIVQGGGQYRDTGKKFEQPSTCYRCFRPTGESERMRVHAFEGMCWECFHMEFEHNGQFQDDLNLCDEPKCPNPHWEPCDIPRDKIISTVNDKDKKE